MNHGKHGIHGKILFEDESYRIRGAIYDVYREMGNGFLEAVYQECMERELALRRVPFESQKQLQLFYKGQPLATRYAADLVCYNKIIVEIKAVKLIKPEYEAQLMNYLKATSMKLGFIVNFGAPDKVEILRRIL